MRISIRCRM